MRSYSTANPATSDVADEARPSLPLDANLDDIEDSFIPSQLDPVNAFNSEELLALELERLARYVARRSENSADRLFERGHYRSLRRRIANLRQWDSTQVDITGLAETPRDIDLHIEAFAALDRKYPSVKRYARKITILHHHLCAEWNEAIFGDTKEYDIDQIRSNWMRLDDEERVMAYKPLLLYLLDCKASRAMLFLQVIADDPILHKMSRETIADALGHLAMIHHTKAYYTNWERGKRSLLKRDFAPNFVLLYHKALDCDFRMCSQDLLFNLANITDTEDFKKAFDFLLENGAHLTFDTLLHYTNKFAKAGEIAYGLRSLEEVRALYDETTWASTANLERLRWSCALVLRKSMSENANYHDTPRIMAIIAGWEIKTDLLLHNIVMHNAMEAYDYATAFKVYNNLEASGLKPDKYTYAILLRGCTKQNYPVMFSQFAEHCAVVADQIQDPWLACDYIYFVYTCYQQDADKGKLFELVRQAYLRFFSWTPLQFMGSLFHVLASTTNGRDQVQPSTPSMATLDPPPMAIYLVLQCAIQSALQVANRWVNELFRLFKLSVKEEKHPGLTELSKNPVIWNAFLLAFCRTRQFESASKLMKNMTNGVPKPNVYSWNFFMGAFFRTDQFHAAERVFELMRDRGVRPDHFTFTILLRGYAKAQDIDRIGEAMQHVDTELEMDPLLLKALSKVVNRKELTWTLDRVRHEKDIKSQEKAKLGAIKEQERWEVPLSQSRRTTRLPHKERIPRRPIHRTKSESQKDQNFGSDQ